MAGSAASTSSLVELAWEQLPLPAMILDGKQRIVTVNRAACEALRLSAEELLGQDPTEIIKTDDPTWCSTDPVDRLGAPSIGQKLEARINGSRRLLRVGVYPLQDEENPAGALVTVRDARASDSDPEEEKDHLTSLGELSACVAHEIRNPLTGIRTTVQFVDSKLGEDDARREDLREVITEIDRIEQIIEDLLMFARPVEGNRVMTDLNALVGRVLDSMQAQFEEAEVEVRRNLSPDLTPFVLSPDNMQQVVLNLVRNALEAMTEGGKLTVTTTLRRFRSGRPPVAELFVSDTGHGIPDDLLDSIFKPFFTTRHNGTGLGLPITVSIVRAHDGRISARNRAHGGATFRVVLPLENEEKAVS
jgi:two-component system sensor histidine kinase HydH